MPRQNVLWKIGLRIYGEGGTQNLLSLPTKIGPLAQGPG